MEVIKSLSLFAWTLNILFIVLREIGISDTRFRNRVPVFTSGTTRVVPLVNTPRLTNVHEQRNIIACVDFLIAYCMIIQH